MPGFDRLASLFAGEGAVKDFIREIASKFSSDSTALGKMAAPLATAIANDEDAVAALGGLSDPEAIALALANRPHFTDWNVHPKRYDGVNFGDPDFDFAAWKTAVTGEGSKYTGFNDISSGVAMSGDCLRVPAGESVDLLLGAFAAVEAVTLRMLVKTNIGAVAGFPGFLFDPIEVGYIHATNTRNDVGPVPHWFSDDGNLVATEAAAASARLSSSDLKMMVIELKQVVGDPREVTIWLEGSDVAVLHTTGANAADGITGLELYDWQGLDVRFFETIKGEARDLFAGLPDPLA